MNRPWMQFHTRDWLDNKELRRCSVEARSVLSDLMCLAHEGEPYGFLADKVGPLTDEYMASRCVIPVVRFRRAIVELVKHERLHQRDGAYVIKRMVEDEEIRIKRSDGGKLGGNPRLKVNQKVASEVDSKVNLADNHQGLPRSDSDSGSKSLSVLETSEEEKTPTRAKEIVSLGRFGDWWSIWSDVRGTANKQESVQAWLSVVTPDLVEPCIECTRSYVESLDDPRKGFNPENFIFKQAKDAFSARWPKARDSPTGDRNQKRRDEVLAGIQYFRGMNEPTRSV